MSQTFEFRLHIIGTEQSWTYTVPVRPEPIIIGRDSGVDLVLEHKHMSPHHAALHCSGTECMFVDLGSANGTRLNGQKLTPRVPVTLKPGDSIQVPGFNLDFEQINVEPSLPLEKEEGPDSSPRQEENTKPTQIKIPSSPPPTLPPVPLPPPFDPAEPPPGLSFRSDRLLSYLPSIYHTDFMANFLAIFEAVLFPIEWQIDGFDLFLDPSTTPSKFLPWLANWFSIEFDPTWSDTQRRAFLKEAYLIYSRSGTRWALCRILEIYCGEALEIDDESEDLPPHMFRVKLPKSVSIDREHIEHLINVHKPAHTTYVLE